MSNIIECEAYLDQISKETDLTPLDLVRTAAERAWGPLGSTYLLRRHFGMTLSEAKELTATLCNEYGLLQIYEAACRAKDPLWPHGGAQP